MSAKNKGMSREIDTPLTQKLLSIIVAFQNHLEVAYLFISHKYIMYFQWLLSILIGDKYEQTKCLGGPPPNRQLASKK